MHRAKEETEGVQKGGEKSEKSENEKDRRRKDALSSARVGEKDIGYPGVAAQYPFVLRQSRYCGYCRWVL